MIDIHWVVIIIKCMVNTIDPGTGPTLRSFDDFLVYAVNVTKRS